jgi:hypothetical protein
VDEVLMEMASLIDQARLLSDAVVNLDVEQVALAVGGLAMAAGNPTVAHVTDTYAALRRTIIDHAPGAQPVEDHRFRADDGLSHGNLMGSDMAALHRELGSPADNNGHSCRGTSRPVAAAMRVTGGILVIAGVLIWAVSHWRF